MITFEVIPYSEISGISNEERISKIIDVTKKNKIALIQGTLSKEDQMDLVKKALSYVNDEFKGIEFAVFESANKNDSFVKKFKKMLLKMFGVSISEGVTLVGPATLIKEIKQDPNNIQLKVSESNKKKK